MRRPCAFACLCLGEKRRPLRSPSLERSGDGRNGFTINKLSDCSRAPVVSCGTLLTVLGTEVPPVSIYCPLKDCLRSTVPCHPRPRDISSSRWSRRRCLFAKCYHRKSTPTIRVSGSEGLTLLKPLSELQLRLTCLLRAWLILPLMIVKYMQSRYHEQSVIRRWVTSCQPYSQVSVQLPGRHVEPGSHC